MATGLAHSARTDLLIGMVNTGVATPIGVALGAFSGYYAGRLVEKRADARVELLQTTPQFILVLMMIGLI